MKLSTTKQTEVGMIPADWDTSTILAISEQIVDFRGRTPKKLGMEWGGGDIPALSAGNVKNGYIDFSKECYFGSEALYKRWMTKGPTRQGDVLFTTEAPLGNVALVPDSRRYILSQRTVLIQVDPKKASSQFLFQFLLSDQFQRILADYSSGSTAKGIQRKKLEQLPLPLPSIPEQRTIAEALGDVDELIGSLERLIAKKRDIKQAVMQQLLTGKTRLPGFAGDWIVKPLGEIAEIVMGQSPSSSHYNACGDGLPLIQGNADIADRKTIRRVFTSQVTKRGKEGDIIMSVRAPVGEIACATFDCCLGRGVCALRFENDFLYHYLIQIESTWARHSTGSTFDSVNSSVIRSVAVCLPPTIDEQAGIAKVLNEMDAELNTIVQRLEKTRLIKQGMMQQLLAGKVRLV